MTASSPTARPWKDGESLVEAFIVDRARERGISRRELDIEWKPVLLDFQSRCGVSDPAAVTAREIDRYIRRRTLPGSRLNYRRTRVWVLGLFFEWLHSTGRIPRDPMENFAAERQRFIEPVTTFNQVEIRKLIFGFVAAPANRGPVESTGDFQRRAAEQSLRERRDTAILAVAYSLALRPGELGHLRRTDYDRSHGTSTLCVRSSWGQAEGGAFYFPVDQRLAAVLDVYFLELGRTWDHRRGLALFPSFSSGTQGDRGISSGELAEILRRRIGTAGIDPKGRFLSPKTLRCSIATHLHRGGVDLLEIQAHMRQDSPDTTLKYIRLPSRTTMIRNASRKAANALWWFGRKPLYLVSAPPREPDEE